MGTFIKNRMQEIVSWKIEPKRYIDVIKKQGYIALCPLNTSFDDDEPESYTLVLKRREKRPKGFYKEYIPINSVNGERIIHKFLCEGSVIIYPEYFLTRKLLKK